MAKIHDLLLNELDLRGLKPSTKMEYLKAIELFSKFHNRKSLDLLGVKEIKEFQFHLLHERKLSARSINKHTTGVRFLYNKVLARNWQPGLIPRMKEKDTLPVIVSVEEIKLMLSVLKDVQHHAIFMTLYSTGIRLSEIQHLKPCDINSKRMVVEINGGKGGVDRYAILSPYLLNCLRNYWVKSKNDKSTWLFSPTRNSFNTTDLNKPMSHTGISYIVKKAAKHAGIKKCLSPHSLRYAFAVHLLEKGTNLKHIQYLLGHKNIRTTIHYLRMCNIDSMNLQSPIDEIIEGGINE